MDEANTFLQNNIKPNSTVVVAVSGGPDSMVLLNLLLQIKPKLKIIVAHVNHKHRLASEEEADMVKKYSQKNGAIFEYMEITEYTDDNFHNYARNKRYEFFEKCLKKYNATYLLTAHHGDDLMETVLMRLTRGSNLKGYAGFAPVIEKENYTLLRPLISYTKAQIKKYATENDIPYRIDESNNEDVYTRNRYRHHILPFLKKEDKNVHQKFYKFSKLLLLCNDYIEKEVQNKLNVIIKKDELDIEKFQKEEEIIKVKIIEEMLNKQYKDDLMLISDVHTSNIINLINSKKSNAKINLPNGKIGIKEYNVFKIVKEEKKENYNFEFSEYLMLPNGHILKQVKDTTDTSNNVIRLDSSTIKLPLYVRNKKDGDKIAVKGLNGAKKIKDIFINEKINALERQTVPLLTDSNDEILWVCGVKKSKFDKQKGQNYDIIVKYF